MLLSAFRAARERTTSRFTDTPFSRLFTSCATRLARRPSSSAHADSASRWAGVCTAITYSSIAQVHVIGGRCDEWLRANRSRPVQRNRLDVLLHRGARAPHGKLLEEKLEFLVVGIREP